MFAPTLPTELAVLLSERLEAALPDMAAVELLAAAGHPIADPIGMGRPCARCHSERSRGN